MKSAASMEMMAVIFVLGLSLLASVPMARPTHWFLAGDGSLTLQGWVALCVAIKMPTDSLRVHTSTFVCEGLD